MMTDFAEWQDISGSGVALEGASYALVGREADGGRALSVKGSTTGFSAALAEASDAGVYPLTAENARALRSRLPWLNPVPLGLRTSAGFGDRLGVATPGHIAAVRGTGVAPIFAQQSVRENTRTGRTPQLVLDDAMWSVFACGWRDPWGADADHLKQPADIPAFADAGYTFFTIDPGDHVDDAAEQDDLATLRAKAGALDWATLGSSLEDARASYLRTFALDSLTLTFDEQALLKALVKYGSAVAHTVRMAGQLQVSMAGRPFEMEISVDETGTTTSLHEHLFIASELTRLRVPFVSLAPRFVGRFEKGVDYIGDLGELDANIGGHAAIVRHFGSSYKLSLHTGSDKFGVYPIAMRHTGGRVHLKTAGTSYLEALRLMANVDPALFRRVLDFARERYETDRRTYHVSALLERVPAIDVLGTSDLPALLDEFDARQVLHVTFGSVLDHFGADLRQMLSAHAAEYTETVRRHFDRHLEAFKTRS
ncbi:MAG: hypothetical protein JNL42_07960 [Anaerolineae bacterium]|nr:hypothetical protein [Anaerolineae bacterium]